ncbi:MFS transporter [Natronoflexus pectinivorans]|uniref:PAT family beta-lactamase induction signal transducer AmpG n=1 Tax=Natronoflexus pectinivorans TaxID=682526 RepID=A0A4R2GJK5_9BACT|nr:MFS transporter [Natronoflexus pectinivorans]TCO08921.1 PAT family beta-lactamase induction signal transducer AmpG [Natronoflexus pectinivorans]
MQHQQKSPWSWVPSLYFTQGIPYVIVMTVAVIMYKRLDISNTDIALYTSWLYLPWMIKPLWSPVVDLLKTKRWWIVTMQLLVGAGLAGVAFTIPMDGFFQYSLAFLWLLAFSSATHDIAADGFYMLALNDGDQSYFVGIRSTFYRIAMIAGQGLLVIAAGFFEEKTGNIPLAWSITFWGITGLFFLLFLYHQFILPKPDADRSVSGEKSRDLMKEFMVTFVSFFEKKGILAALLFLLLYRLGEAQLVKLASPFLLDPADAGGLGLSTGDVGWIYGTFGIGALMLGGITGGLAVSRKGLKYWLFPMAVAMNAPNLAFVYLSWVLPESVYLVGAAVVVEQFGYGFGFTAYVMFMIWFSEGSHKTAHYAICTGLMAAGMMFPGMISGYLQELAGYPLFFVWVVLCTIPGFIIIRYLKIAPDFGIKKKQI